ncbi:MAG TPA: hypothetical protein DCR17_05375 [Verrucomicrobiales bacterium]|nr:hypothetical protein [Pedosphaera sp.]HAO66100.1 hypothetical protein [Verrucomicrobiales bacterium]HAW00513.1 hypothetical protein [Verrucomicrobiales bacterium]HBP54840.1 hypothetical protein [Verrucomicrobiales bacterium]HCP38252.1 hypothetical protein [Verrucomicrobiales bacterium]
MECTLKDASLKRSNQNISISMEGIARDEESSIAIHDSPGRPADLCLNSARIVASIPVVACYVFAETLEQTFEITKPTDAYPYGHKCENGYGEKKKNGPECLPHIVDLSCKKVL